MSEVESSLLVTEDPELPLSLRTRASVAPTDNCRWQNVSMYLYITFSDNITCTCTNVSKMYIHVALPCCACISLNYVGKTQYKYESEGSLPVAHLSSSELLVVYFIHTYILYIHAMVTVEKFTTCTLDPSRIEMAMVRAAIHSCWSVSVSAVI